MYCTMYDGKFRTSGKTCAIYILAFFFRQTEPSDSPVNSVFVDLVS